MAGRPVALITGATAGIGAAFASRLAADAYDLVLVARDETRLHDRAEALKRAHGATVEVLPADLATPEGTAAVADRLSTRDGVHLLVNNAGITLRRGFLESSVADQERLLHLNVHAVMRLTHAALPAMLRRGDGGVINVSSVAGFAPVWPGSTYPATKAWVTSFSASVAGAVARHGVRVLALCPGFVRTEFHQRAGVDVSRMPSWWWLDADRVAARALRDLARGRVVSVVDWRYRIVAAGMRHLPLRLVRAVAGGVRVRSGRGQRGQ